MIGIGFRQGKIHQTHFYLTWILDVDLLPLQALCTQNSPHLAALHESDCFVELSRISEVAEAAKFHGWC